MSLQQIIGAALLAAGIAFGIRILSHALKNRQAVSAENGCFSVLCLLEAPLYFCATLGISDFLLNTLVFRHLHLADDKKLPGTLCTACLVPGAVIAFSLLQAENPVDLRTLLCCSVSIALGSAAGSRFVGKLDGAKIRKYLGYALLVSMGALILRILLSRGTPGVLLGLSGRKLAFAVVFSFFWGAFNMLGVPMKPAGTAMFLLLGLSPLNTLTLLLVMCCIGPFGGAVPVLKSGNYHQKLVCAAVLGGSLGAVLGSLLALSLPALVLNVLLLAVMLIAIISIFRE